MRALSGEIGGHLSHEFHMVVDSGESEIFYNKSIEKNDFKNIELNKILKLESYTDDFYNKIPKKIEIPSFRSIELGHIFLFGSKYSDSFDFTINSESGKFKPYMGSYGIGISRIPAAIIELFHDKNGIIWPKEVSPFQIILINLLNDNETTKDFCEKLYDQLISSNFEVIYDDRNERSGTKFADADLIGIPLQVIVGKNLTDKRKVSIKYRNNHNEFEIDASDCPKSLMEIING